MTPDFSRAIDPIIEYMVELKDRIQRRNVASPQNIRQAMVNLLQDADSVLRNRMEEWDLAKYALVVWIDEDLSAEDSWAGWQFWTEHKLVQEVPGRKGEQFVGREEFFRRAQEAGRLTRKDALEVYFLCVVLGFQGVYDGAPGLLSPVDLRRQRIQIPDTREDWLRNTREWIRTSQLQFDGGRPDDEEHFADLLSAKFQFLQWIVAFLGTSLFAGLALFFAVQMKLIPWPGS
jgi:type VI secretion system protein ImpK